MYARLLSVPILYGKGCQAGFNFQVKYVQVASKSQVRKKAIRFRVFDPSSHLCMLLIVGAGWRSGGVTGI